MKTHYRNRFKTGVSRVEILVITCVVLIGIYAAVSYQKTGELFHVSWRKKADNKKPVPQEPRSPVAGIIQPIQHSDPQNNQTPEAQDPSVLLVSTYEQRSDANRNDDAAIASLLLDKSRKQRVQMPQNPVWGTNLSRKGPGVKIAFP